MTIVIFTEAGAEARFEIEGETRIDDEIRVFEEKTGEVVSDWHIERE